MTEPASEMDVIRYFHGRPMHIGRKGEALTLRQWAEAYCDKEGRTVARTAISDTVEVATMWMGLDSDPLDDGPPLIFGSIIIIHGNGNNSFKDEIETATEDEAMEAHRTLVERAKAEL